MISLEREISRKNGNLIMLDPSLIVKTASQGPHILGSCFSVFPNLTPVVTGS